MGPVHEQQGFLEFLAGEGNPLEIVVGLRRRIHAETNNIRDPPPFEIDLGVLLTNTRICMRELRIHKGAPLNTSPQFLPIVGLDFHALPPLELAMGLQVVGQDLLLQDVRGGVATSIYGDELGSGLLGWGLAAEEFQDAVYHGYLN